MMFGKVGDGHFAVGENFVGVLQRRRRIEGPLRPKGRGFPGVGRCGSGPGGPSKSRNHRRVPRAWSVSLPGGPWRGKDRSPCSRLFRRKKVLTDRPRRISGGRNRTRPVRGDRFRRVQAPGPDGRGFPVRPRSDSVRPAIIRPRKSPTALKLRPASAPPASASRGPRKNQTLG